MRNRIDGRGPAVRQRGAALVIGLILLLVLTILAVSGVFTSTLELRMVGNQQQQERAFQAAEVAVEEAMASPQLSTAAPQVQAPVAVPGAPDDRYQYTLRFVGETTIPPGTLGYSIGSGFTAYNFEIEATGTAGDGGLSEHVQGFYIIGPGGS